MKKLILLIVFVSGLHFISKSQTLSPAVLATNGGYFTGGGSSLSWTIGETFHTTLQNGGLILSQGQQQPYIELRILNLKLFLEGFYTGGGMMDTYGNGGCLFLYGASSDPTDADTVIVSAMDGITKALVDSKTGVMKIDGSVSVTFGPAVVSGNNYYIKVNHRNTIETWSASPVLFTSPVSYDFTTGLSQSYGNNMIDIGTLYGDGPKWAFYSGDIVDAGYGLGGIPGIQDGIIESLDYSEMENAANITLTGYVNQDITGDLVTESTDYSIMENNAYFTIFVLSP